MQYTSNTENYSSSLRDSPSRWSGKGKEDKGYVYKKSSYQYSSNGNNSSAYQSPSTAQNVDQLDALLEDLKNERQLTTREREILPIANYRTIERERAEPSGTVLKTTRVIKTTKHSGGPHQLADDVETYSTSDYNTLKSNYSSFQDGLKRDEYQTKDKIYGLDHSPSGGHYESRTKIYESKSLNNTEIVPTTTTTSSTNIEKELQDIALSDDILPVPGTKVTTTVRTYTYEIPAGGVGSTTNTINRSQRLNNNVTTYNSLQKHETNTGHYPHAQPQPHPTVPQTVVYNTESYSTLNRNSERPILTNQSYEIREHKETNTINNGPSPQHPYSERDVPIVTDLSPGLPPTTNKKIVYSIHKTDNVHTVNDRNRYPPHSPAHSPTTNSAPYNLPPGGTTNRYFYKETSNVVNTIHGPGGPNGEPIPSPLKQAPPTANYPTQPPNRVYQPQPVDGNYPPNTTTYSYNYTSTSNKHLGPDYGAPSPFPVDGVQYPVSNGNPPQRVDDLMQSFGNTDAVDRVDIENPVRKREIETAVASPTQQHVPSVNKAGKEVYYPPGHDVMLTKREEMSAASAGGGRWAKGSGMYEYESGYKSKSKTKSGGAMVPVCLPLCCAMPCTIM